MEQVQKRTGDAALLAVAEISAELNVPEFPRELSYIWRIYNRLRRRMAGGFAGPNPISWQDIDAFVRQTKFRLAPWEIELLEALDDAFLQPAYVALRDKARPSTATEMIDPSDTQSVRNLMRSIGRRRSADKVKQ